MKKSLSDIALEIEAVRSEIKSLEKYWEMITDKDNYIALVVSGDIRALYSRDEIYRYKRLDIKLKEPVLNLINKELKLQNKKIFDLETEIKDGTIHAITEPTEPIDTPEVEAVLSNVNIPRKSFFQKLFK